VDLHHSCALPAGTPTHAATTPQIPSAPYQASSHPAASETNAQTGGLGLRSDVKALPTRTRPFDQQKQPIGVSAVSGILSGEQQKTHSGATVEEMVETTLCWEGKKGTAGMKPVEDQEKLDIQSSAASTSGERMMDVRKGAVWVLGEGRADMSASTLSAAAVTHSVSQPGSSTAFLVRNAGQPAIAQDDVPAKAMAKGTESRTAALAEDRESLRPSPDNKMCRTTVEQHPIGECLQMSSYGLELPVEKHSDNHDSSAHCHSACPDGIMPTSPTTLRMVRDAGHDAIKERARVQTPLTNPDVSAPSSLPTKHRDVSSAPAVIPPQHKYAMSHASAGAGARVGPAPVQSDKAARPMDTAISSAERHEIDAKDTKMGALHVSSQHGTGRIVDDAGEGAEAGVGLDVECIDSPASMRSDAKQAEQATSVSRDNNTSRMHHSCCEHSGTDAVAGWVNQNSAQWGVGNGNKAPAIAAQVNGTGEDFLGSLGDSGNNLETSGKAKELGSHPGQGPEIGLQRQRIGSRTAPEQVPGATGNSNDGVRLPDMALRNGSNIIMPSACKVDAAPRAGITAGLLPGWSSSDDEEWGIPLSAPPASTPSGVPLVQSEALVKTAAGVSGSKLAGVASTTERHGPADVALQDAGAMEGCDKSSTVAAYGGAKAGNAAAVAGQDGPTSENHAIQCQNSVHDVARFGTGKEDFDSTSINEAAIAARKAEAEAGAWASGEPYFYEAWGCYVSVCGQYYQDDAYGGWRLVTEYGTDVHKAGQCSQVQTTASVQAPTHTAGTAEAGMVISTGNATSRLSCPVGADNSAGTDSRETQKDFEPCNDAGVFEPSHNGAACIQRQVVGVGNSAATWDDSDDADAAPRDADPKSALHHGIGSNAGSSGAVLQQGRNAVGATMVGSVEWQGDCDRVPWDDEPTAEDEPTTASSTKLVLSTTANNVPGGNTSIDGRVNSSTFWHEDNPMACSNLEPPNGSAPWDTATRPCASGPWKIADDTKHAAEGHVSPSSAHLGDRGISVPFAAPNLHVAAAQPLWKPPPMFPYVSPGGPRDAPPSSGPAALQTHVAPCHPLTGINAMQSQSQQLPIVPGPPAAASLWPPQSGLAPTGSLSARRPTGGLAGLPGVGAAPSTSLPAAYGQIHSSTITCAAAQGQPPTHWHPSSQHPSIPALGTPTLQVKHQNEPPSWRAAQEGVTIHWQSQQQDVHMPVQLRSHHQVPLNPSPSRSMSEYASMQMTSAPALQQPWQASGGPVAPPLQTAYPRPVGFQSQLSWSPQRGPSCTAAAPVDTRAPRTIRDALTSSSGRPPSRRLSIGLGGRVAYLERSAPTYDYPNPSITLCSLSNAHLVAAGMPTKTAQPKQSSAPVAWKHVIDWPGPMSERAPALKALAACVTASAKAAAAVGNESLATLWRTLGVMAQYKGCLVGGEVDRRDPGASAAVLKVLREAFGPSEGGCLLTSRLCSGFSFMPPAVDAAATARQAELALLGGDKEAALQIAMQGKVRLSPHKVA
jgi:hypothetical protein